MRKRLSDLLTATLVACAIVVVGLVAHRKLAPAPPGAAVEIREVANWEAIGAVGSLLGPPEADVRIVEFSDFQCPFCAQVRTDLQRLRQDHPGRVTIVYRHLPLEAIHPHAFGAALAAECAGAQGRFEAYHNALFERQDSIGIRSWKAFATEAGVPDVESFGACMEEEHFRERVEMDARAAEEIGVAGTPAFILNGKLVMGLEGPARLSLWVQEALRVP